MSPLAANPPHAPTTSRLNVAALAKRIATLQDRDGRIHWVDNGLWDPWNHCEAAMGLAVAGDQAGAQRALEALIMAQTQEGYWQADMGCAAPMTPDAAHLDTAGAPQIIDTNFCAYPAVFAWHLSLITKDTALARRAASMVERACEWLMPLQRAGVFPWRALDGRETPADVDALVTGNASIALSLACALCLLEALDRPTAHIRQALGQLVAAFAPGPHAQRRGDHLATPPGPFLEKPRHAMDWYYPILAGVLPHDQAADTLDRRWTEFVHPNFGCRCVNDEPWATAAETAELVIALNRLAPFSPRAAQRLHQVLASLNAHLDPQGGLWMGFQFEQNRPWPEERPSWTAGAAILAIDVVERRTPGADVFTTLWPNQLV